MDIKKEKHLNVKNVLKEGVAREQAALAEQELSALEGLFEELNRKTMRDRDYEGRDEEVNRVNELGFEIDDLKQRSLRQ
jgi:C4-type Zn-finger protein